MNEVVVKCLCVDELFLLGELFEYKNLDEMIQRNSKKIESGDIEIFVLYYDRSLVGELRVMYSNPDERFAQRGKRAYLYAFRIHKDFQNKGLGKYLLRYVEEKLINAGYLELTVGVEDDNEIAKHIYKNFGFERIIARIREEYQGEEYEYNLYLKNIGEIYGN